MSIKVAIKKKALAMAFFACMAVQATLVHSSMTENRTSNQFETIKPPELSDTVITKTWEAEETLSEWWNANWLYRKKITLTEPGLMDRDRDPVDVHVEFTGDVARENSLRIAYYDNSSTWNEVDSQVWNASMHQNGTGQWFYDACTITFFLNITKSDVEVYYLYYDPFINTPPSYTDRINVRGVNYAGINDDALMPTLQYVNGTNAPNVDAFEIIVDGDTATPQSVVCLVDTMRGESDWGGPSCSIVSAEYNDDDALSLSNLQWMSLGEMALDAIGHDSITNVPNGFSGSFRANVGPDNPAEAWDGNGQVQVLDDGPLFTRIKIQTTDGAYQDPTSGDWWRDDLDGAISADTVSRGNGAAGYVKYNITYTYFYRGPATFVKIDLDFEANPQRGISGYPLNGYTNNTNMYFKNYGDWPHLMQFVSADWDYPTRQNMKSWYGSKYGYFQEDIGERRRDYPLEPWTAWWDNSSGTDPTIGMFALTEGVGWEVLSLAVNDIGNNSLLQQILPEGHQGDQFLLENGSILSYDYYMLTTAHGTNDTQVRDMTRRMNEQVDVEVGAPELFEHNSLFIHVNDIDGATALGTSVRVFDSSMVKVNDSQVNSIGNVTFQRLPDDNYTVEVYFLTDNLANEYVVQREEIELDHLVNRAVFREYTCDMANLTLNVVNWANASDSITGAKIQLLNATTSVLIEQNFTTDGYVAFRLFTDGSTQYNLAVIYGGTNRTINVTSPYLLTGNILLHVGVQIETTAITVDSQDSSVPFGDVYDMEFYFHKSASPTDYIDVSDIEVSDDFNSGFWTDGVDYSWSFNPSTNLTSLQLFSGFGSKLNDTGQFEVYLHVKNDSVETTIEKLFVIVDAKASDIQVLINGSDITDSLIYEVSQNATMDLLVYFIDNLTVSNITNTATVNLTHGTDTWLLSPSGEGYNILINTSDLGIQSKYVFTLRCSNQSMQTQIFRFTAFSTDVNTTIETLVNGLNQSALGGEIVRLGDTINFSVAYENLFTGSPVIGATVQVRFTNDYTGTTEVLNLAYDGGSLTYTTNPGDLLLDTAIFKPQSKLFTITAVRDGYESKSETFLVSIERINSSMDVLVEGLNQEDLSDEDIRLGDAINFSVGFWENGTTTPVLGAMVQVQYTNDFTDNSMALNLSFNPGSNRYESNATGLPLSLSSFTSQFKVFTIVAMSDSYEWKTQTFVVNIKRVAVLPELNVEGNVTGNDIYKKSNERFTFRIRLVNGLDNTSFIDLSSVSVSLFNEYLGEIELEKETSGGNFTGYFSAGIQAPRNSRAYELKIIVDVTNFSLVQQFEFETDPITLHVLPRQSPIPVWAFYLLLGIIGAMTVYFILYQVRFKYPPIIRKIHDLKRSVSRGKKTSSIKEQKVKNREENIYELYSKSINTYSFLQTKDTKFAAKSAGYAPLPDESIELEFEMPSLDGGTPEPGKQVAPKKLKRPAAPTLEKPSAKPVTGPGEPAVKKIKRPLPSIGKLPEPGKPVSKPAPSKPAPSPLAKPTTKPVSLPKPVTKPTAEKPKTRMKPISTDNLYQQLVLLEQKRYKAERSIRDLNAKHNKGQISDSEFQEYEERLQASLAKIKEQITDLRRRLISL